MNQQESKETQKFKSKITKELVKSDSKTITSILKNLNPKLKKEKTSIFDRVKNLLSFILSLF